MTSDAHQPIADPVAGVRSLGRPASALEPWDLDVTDPTTGERLARSIGGGVADARRALDAAAAALPEWAATSPVDRARALRQVASELRSNADELARLITLETGKRLVEGQAEVELSAAFFDWYAEVAATSCGQRWSVRKGVEHRVGAQPVGVVAVVTPWNFPLSIPARKLAALAAAGCTAVFKPAQAAPLSGLRLAEIVERTMPPGGLETVVGPASHVVGTWLSDRRVRAVTFTGSTEVGRGVARAAGEHLCRAVLELGGNAPAIVLDDADIDDAVSCAVVAKYRNNGQSCIAANQAFVPRRLVADFLDCFAKRSAELVVGDPMEPETGLGPVCLPSDPPRLAEIVAEAASSSTLHTGQLPQAAGSRGFWVAPTWWVQEDPDASVLDQELFGPLLPIVPYDNLDDVLARARRSPVGLAGYVLGSDLERATAVAEALDVGIVGVNTGAPNTPQVPFAPRRDSGLGVEGGYAGLEPFVAWHTVALSSTGQT